MPIVIVPLVGFAFLLTFLVLYGMERGNNQWLVPLVRAFAHPQGSFLKRTALKAVGAVLGAVSWIVRYVTHYLSVAASHSIGAVAQWVHGLAAWVEHVGAAAGDFAVAVEHAIGRVVHQTIPREIHKATVPLHRGIDALEGELSRVVARLRVFERGIDRIITHRVLPAIRAAEHAIAVTIPRAIARERAQIKDLQRILYHPSDAWIKRIMRRGWVLVLAGVVVKFLVKKFPHLFCRNVTKTAKAICNPLNNLLVDLLLGEALAVFVLTDICTTVKAIEGVADRAAPLLLELVTGSEDFFDWCGGDLPTAHDPPGYSGGLLPTAHS